MPPCFWLWDFKKKWGNWTWNLNKYIHTFTLKYIYLCAHISTHYYISYSFYYHTFSIWLLFNGCNSFTMLWPVLETAKVHCSGWSVCLPKNTEKSRMWEQYISWRKRIKSWKIVLSKWENQFNKYNMPILFSLCYLNQAVHISPEEGG